MPHALPVLMYHSISRFGHHLCVSPERFEEHCRLLAKQGWRGIALAEAEEHFLKGKPLPRKTCLFTFDDGYFDNHVYAEPLLRQYGHHGVIFPVVNMVEDGPERRHSMEDLARKPGLAKNFARLDARRTSLRCGKWVAGIVFCNWAELKHMHFQGNISAAPHSLDHSRVVTSLNFRKLYLPKRRSGFFATPPHEVIPGFPVFRLGHSLVNRGYRLAPELFELIRRMVPQDAAEARAFLGREKNRAAVIRAIQSLPSLGRLESEDEYRTRIATEFTRCREIFREKMDVDPASFCWPWGSFSRTALAEAREAGFRLFFTTGGRPSFLSKAGAVYRISVRGQSAGQLLCRVRFASGAVGEGLAGLFAQQP